MNRESFEALQAHWEGVRMPDQGQDVRPESADIGRDSRGPETEPDIDFGLFVEGLSDLVCLHEPDGTYTWVSPSIQRILGYEPSEIIGKNPYDLFHPEDARLVRESTHEPALDGQGNIFVRYRLRHKHGHYVWLESLTQPHLDDAGRVVRLQTSSRDISEQKAMEQALQEGEERYRAVVHSLTEAVVVYGHEGRIISCNPSACRILGVSEDDLLGVRPGDKLWDAVDGQGRPLPMSQHPVIKTMKSGEPCREVVIGLKRPNADRRTWIAVNTKAFERTDERLIVTSFRDITEWLETRRELDLLAKVFETSSEAILISDTNHHVVAVNQAFTQLTGYTFEDLAGKPSSLLRAGDHPPEFYEEIWKALERRGFWRGETWNRGKHGNVYPVWLSITAVRNSAGETTHYISICADISEQHAREEHQRFLATHDSLTGLANRALTYDRIETEIRRCERDGQTFAVLFVDLDGFKPVNDEHGHRVGDILLRKVARRMSKQVRASDTVSRLGGDEFIVLLTGIDNAGDARSIACKLADRLARPYRVGELEVTIGASIGLSLFPESGTDVEALIHAADLAMYDAKGDPAETVAIASPRGE
jgi:diguanylate cyclase (GGDEF)-like protein/PAS domain S-box-containing protein